MQYLTTKNRDPYNKTHCRRESDRLSRIGQHTNIILDHHETRYKQRHIRLQIKIHVHGRKVILPEQPDGQGEIHHDPDFNDTTRICRKYRISQKKHTMDTYMQE